MTALCLCNNISRHIKITSMVLNFVTEICSNFLELKKNSVWVLNFILTLRSNFLELKIMFLDFEFRIEICNILLVLKIMFYINYVF